MKPLEEHFLAFFSNLPEYIFQCTEENFSPVQESTAVFLCFVLCLGGCGYEQSHGRLRHLQF